jgi:hypothetical protein
MLFRKSGSIRKLLSLFRLIRQCHGHERHGLLPGQVRVRFVLGKVALGQVFFRVLLLSPFSIILQILRTHVDLNTTLMRRTIGRSLLNFSRKKKIAYANVRMSGGGEQKVRSHFGLRGDMNSPIYR